MTTDGRRPRTAPCRNWYARANRVSCKDEEPARLAGNQAEGGLRNAPLVRIDVSGHACRWEDCIGCAPHCGSPPLLPVQSQEYESIKGELEGKAEFLSRLIGNGNLKGAVEAEHRTIYQAADAIQAAWQSAYLSYLFCSTVMSDNTMSSQEKLNAIVVFRQGMCTVPQNLFVKLAELVQEGSQIQSDFLSTDDAGAIDQRYKEWEPKVEKLLNENLGVVFLVQFTSVHGGGLMPVSHSMIGGGIWAEMQAKIIALNSIIQDLRHC
jgi:hypothetical protein